MEEVEVTWGRALRVWWSWVWRTFLIAFVCGILIGVLAFMFGVAMGMESTQVELWINLGSSLIGLVAGLYIMKAVLSMRFQ